MPDLSPWESEILRFPGHVPGVLREGSVGWWRSENGRRKRMQVLRTVAEGPSWCGGKPSALVTLVRYWPEEMAKVEAVSDLALQQEAWVTCWLPRDELEIDLTDATGRAHLAWRLQLEHGSGGGSIEDGGFRIDWQPGRWAWARPGCENTGREWFLCSPLQFGSKDDGRSLPDGSSLLRALALGIIARHVAGLPIPVRP